VVSGFFDPWNHGRKTKSIGRASDSLIGFIFSVRNPGNVIPHSQHFVDEFTMCESAALELGCVVNDIKYIIVCGHSDCKAMNLLYALRDEEFASQVRFSCIHVSRLKIRP